MTYRIECASAEDFLASLPDNSVDLILTDPPYCGVKSDSWDNQWKTSGEFIAWIGSLCSQWARVLKSNGSLYVFASPQMAARVECAVAEKMEIVNRITWRKPPFSTKAEMFRKEDLRGFFPASEAIIFAERRDGDRVAGSDAGYASKSADLHCDVYGRVFGNYFRAEFARAGVTSREIAALFPSRTGRPTGCVSNWLLGYNCPTAEQYATIRSHLGEAFLRAEYESLRAEYESLRRPFSVTADVPYTDVWDFPTVGRYAGKHPCEKPAALARHIINASSRPGATVLDTFCGSGVFLAESVRLGRHALGCDFSAPWVEEAMKRCREAEQGPAQGKLLEVAS